MWTDDLVKVSAIGIRCRRRTVDPGYQIHQDPGEATVPTACAELSLRPRRFSKGEGKWVVRKYQYYW